MSRNSGSPDIEAQKSFRTAHDADPESGNIARGRCGDAAVSRRAFLAGSAALIAAPAIAAPANTIDVDVAIIGAGAAGIAAARRVAAANRSVTLFEASNRIGGRCATDTQFFGVPFDIGAHWIHNPAANPVLRQANKSAFDIYMAPRGQTMRVGNRAARDVELEKFLPLLLRAQRALAESRRLRVDMPASRALPKDLGDWRGTIDLMLGSYALGKELVNVSAIEAARAMERDSAAFCRQGYGAILAQLAAGLPVRLATPVTMVASNKNFAVLETPQGDLRARAVIVTASTNVLAAGKIEFIPALSKRHLDAANTLSLGSFDHIALEIPDNPFVLQKDDLVFQQTRDLRTAALLANVSGTALHLVEVGGAFGRELSAQGEAAMVAFAGEWLSDLFGSSAKRAIKRSRATRWNEEPWTLGAMSAPPPDAGNARKALAEPIGNHIWFAGEALHDTQWGTVSGAWETGERAADAILRWYGWDAVVSREQPAARNNRSSRSNRSNRRSRTNRRPNGIQSLFGIR